MAAALVGLLGLAGSGCGEIALPMWINIDPDQSSAIIDLGGSTVELALEGGVYAEIDLDTSNLLLIEGTVTVPDIRFAASDHGTFWLGQMCIWRDLETDPQGLISMNLVTGETVFEFPLGVRAWSSIMSPNMGEFVLSPEPGAGGIPFEPDIGALLGAVATGNVDGVLEIPLELTDTIEMLGMTVPFTMDLLLVSSSTPPDYTLEVTPHPLDGEPDYLVDEYCRSFWESQGVGTMYLIDPKGTYLETLWDNPAPPRVVELADLGAEPGDTLRITRHGGYHRWLGSPEFQQLTAVFSGSDELLGPASTCNRVVDAIDAGEDVVTLPTFWWFQRTDIPEDFAIQDSVDVAIPAGATHLFFSTWDNLFSDNLSKAIRVEIEVNP
jgi:hypothetical protein